MTAKQITESTTETLLNEVLKDERENGCSNRAKLAKINNVLIARKGKTVNQLLEEKGM